MKILKQFSVPHDEGRLIATFGNARLLKFMDGAYELIGGSNADQTEAREWISLFGHEVVLRNGTLSRSAQHGQVVSRR